MEFAKLNNAASVRMAVGFGVIRLRKRFSALDLRALSFSHWVCMWYQIKNNNQIQNDIENVIMFGNQGAHTKMC